MFSWEIKAVQTTNAKPQDIWEIWTDVSDWKSWDTDLEWSKINGKFEVGTTGTLKPKGWFSSNFTITEMNQDKSHCETTYLPFTTLQFNHTLEEISDRQVKITHNLKVSGLLSPLLWLTMRFKLRNTIPEALTNLVQKLENS